MNILTSFTTQLQEIPKILQNLGHNNDRNLLEKAQALLENYPDHFWSLFHLISFLLVCLTFLVTFLLLRNKKTTDLVTAPPVVEVPEKEEKEAPHPEEPKEHDKYVEEKEFEEEEVLPAATVIPKEEPPAEKPKPKVDEASLFQRLRKGLTKTRESFVKKLDTFLAHYKKIDEELFEDVFSALIAADVGVSTSEQLIELVKERLESKKLEDPQSVKTCLKEIIAEVFEKSSKPIEVGSAKPWVIMVIGVNGVGKTTTIGKLANMYKSQGKKVMLAAADTFRAAAIEQLEVWANRNEVDIVKHQAGSDPSAVVFDALKSAKSKGSDIVIVDTAGRLHTKVNLMEELAKIKRVISRESEEGPHEILQILDATTGQNAVQQVQTFKEMVDVNGIILTKLDGTAKGGICISISNEFTIPIKYIGIGEQIDDLRDFVGKDFTEALF